MAVSQAWTGAKSQAGEKDDLLARCLVSLQSDCNTVTLQVEALQKENRAMKELELEVLRSNTPREVETVIPRSGAHCVSGVLAGVTKSLDEAEPEAPLVIQPRKSKGKKRGKTKSFGIPDSPSVSLSAARLGMVTQRQELMEELETEQVHLRTMLSEFVPSGERRNVHRTRNCLQKISRRGGLSRRRARSRRRRQLTDVEGEGGWAERAVCVALRLRHLAFKISVVLVILLNSAYLGFDADLQVKNSYRHVLEQEPWDSIPVIPYIFPILFVLELMIRLGADRCAFFQGEERWSITDLSVLRIMRVFRRPDLVLDRHRGVGPTRDGVGPFMIMLIIFVFSILFCHGVAQYNYSSVERFGRGLVPEDWLTQASETRAVYGSLWETCVSLFGAVTGGNDWMFYGGYLRNLKMDENDLTGEIYFIVFGFYVAFCTVGLLNVVTGIFVDSAVTTRTEDEDEMNNRQQEVRRIFQEAVGEEDTNDQDDAPKKPMLTFDQLKEQLDNPWSQAYFSGLDIDPNEAAIIFTLMAWDTDHNGRVTIDEFIDGTMKLKGSAKSVDMLLLMFDHVRFMAKFNTLCCYMEDEMRSIKSVILPGAPRTASQDL
eukprot:g19377.t3